MIYADLVVYLAALAVLARARSAETRYYAGLVGFTSAAVSCLYWGQW